MTESIILEQQPGRSGERSSTARRRLYIFPTQYGLIYAVMLAVMLMGAVNYTNSMAYMLTFMLGSLFLVGMLHTYRNLRGLIISTGDARPVFAGETAEFPVVFDNRTGPRRTSLHVHPWPRGRKPRHFRSHGIEFTRIDPGQMYRDTLPVAAAARGRLQPGRLRIHSAWPLGLFRAWSYMDCRSVCIVYPRPAGATGLPIPLEDASRDQTGTQAGTDDFTGFRPYRPGDSIRNIDWKVLAREQGLLVRKFRGTGARRLVIDWHQAAHLVDTEARLSQLALWIIEAERQGLRYGLSLPGTEIEADHGDAHRHRCLLRLAIYGLRDGD